MIMSSSKPVNMLDWIDSEESELLPIMMSDATSTTASVNSVKLEDVTPAMVCACTDQLGLWPIIDVDSPSLFDPLAEMPDFEEKITYKTENGVQLRLRTINTPAGELSEVYKQADATPAMWLKNLVTEGYIQRICAAGWGRVHRPCHGAC